MNPKNYWENQHQKYFTFDWIDKPTIFIETAIEYFPKNSKVLELGCGQGQDTRYIADHGYNVVATDFSEEALKFANQKTKNENSNINYQLVDLTQPLSFEDNSFDVVYSHLTLHYFDKTLTQKIFNEIARVLKKNGILAILLNTVDDSETKENNIEIEKDFYEVNGIEKRYFSPNSLEEFTRDNFDVIILDNKGETHKDRITSLIRFIGKKK